MAVWVLRGSLFTQFLSMTISSRHFSQGREATHLRCGWNFNYHQGRCYGSWSMEEADKDWMMIRMVGRCFFWYWLTRVVPNIVSIDLLQIFQRILQYLMKFYVIVTVSKDVCKRGKIMKHNDDATYTLCSIKKRSSELMSITLSNLNQFWKFFHC